MTKETGTKVYFDVDGQPGRGPDGALYPTEILSPVTGAWMPVKRLGGARANVCSKETCKKFAATWLAHHGARLPKDLA